VLATEAARVVGTLARLTGHRGTALPGMVAERIDPTILTELAAGLDPVIVVLGTNGKTTTTRLIATILEQVQGAAPVTNRSGANLRQGIASALINDPSVRRGGPRVPAVLEVDELAFGGVVAALRPRVVVILNLLRDQLDRYGEIDRVERRWRQDFARLPTTAVLVACADDPRLESLARAVDRPVLRFGLAASGRPPADARSLADAWAADAPSQLDVPGCPSCGERVVFSPESCGGLADWACPSCGTIRAELDLGVTVGPADASGTQALSFVGRAVEADSPHPRSVSIGLSGSAAAHDAAAAILAALSIGVTPAAAIAALDGATPAFGRLEDVAIGDKHVVLTLAKNPASLAQATEAAVIRRPDALLIGLSDKPADGRDVSWIWDAALERLRSIPSVTVTGSRADDMMLRFKYDTDDAVPAIVGRRVEIDRSVDRAFDASLGRVRPGGTLMVLATYTALLGIRGLLERRGAAPVLPR
jgi:UDP-N-acetylmuramyl tripeptide synthase